MLSDDDIEKVVQSRLPKLRDLNPTVHWDQTVKQAGETISVGPRMIAMPFDGYVVFVDLAPGANWGHPVKYFLVSIESNDVKEIDDEFPPLPGELSPQFRRIS